MTGEMTLNSPLAEEQWGAITDVDFDHTSNYGLKLNTGKRVEFVKCKTGQWISADAVFGGAPYYCNQCGETTRDTVMGEPRWKYCPMCGVKMEDKS